MSGPRLPHTLDDISMDHFKTRAGHSSFDPRYHEPAALPMVSKHDNITWKDSIESGSYVRPLGEKRPTLPHLMGSKRLHFQE